MDKLKNLLDSDYERIAVALAGEVSELRTLRERRAPAACAVARRQELEDARATSRRELWQLQHARLELERARADDAQWLAHRARELDAAGAARGARARRERARARARRAIEGERAELETLRTSIGNEWRRLAKIARRSSCARREWSCEEARIATTALWSRPFLADAPRARRRARAAARPRRRARRRGAAAGRVRSSRRSRRHRRQRSCGPASRPRPRRRADGARAAPFCFSSSATSGYPGLTHRDLVAMARPRDRPEARFRYI